MMFSILAWDEKFTHNRLSMIVSIVIIFGLLFPNVIKYLFKTTPSEYVDTHGGNGSLGLFVTIIFGLYIFFSPLGFLEFFIKPSILSKYWYVIIPITQLILTILIIDVIRFNYKSAFKKEVNFFASTKKIFGTKR